ncbi:MAG: type II secretion system F family protein [Patescibacteria group bacterium]
MPLFEYKAKNSRGQNVSGLVESNDQESAAEILTDRELILISIEEKKKNIFEGLKFFGRIKTKDVVIFSRQLAVMISATIPIVKSLQVLTKQITNPRFKKIISDIADDVDGGSQLSSALAKHDDVFDDFFISMIKTGETTGRLDKVLVYLADQKEKSYELNSKVKGMLIYPVFVFFMLIAVGVIVMVFVVPKLINVITESGGELPFSTRLLIGTSNFLVNWWWILLIISIGLVFLYKVYTKTKDGKHHLDYLKLKVPIFGPLFQRIYLVRFSQSLATLSDGGVPLPYALEVISEVVGNEVYKDLILETKKDVEDGNPIAGVFLESDVVPDMISQTLSIGEQSGKLSEILSKVSDFYSKEIESILENIVALIEPVVIIIMGVAVAMMVSAVILPMYSMSTAM